MVKIDRLLGKAGETLLISGNEAIARGCIESGVRVASCYPGTPSSEITDTLIKLAEKAGIYVEYSTNEKVALEVAAGAAISGLRSIASMKHVGLNVASDALVTLAYTGVRAGCVVVSADDPECWSSQNEQDNRYYSMLAGIPCLEPSNAQEAKDMAVEAFRLSEKLEVTVLLRPTTRVNHTLSPVTLGDVDKGTISPGFVKEPKRYVMIPSNALIRHETLLKRLDEAERISESTPFNRVVRDGGEVGIVTSGVSVNYSLEAVEKLDIAASVLKLGMTHPLPSKLVLDFIDKFEMIFIVEELEPILENAVRSIAFAGHKRPAILGKLTGHLPRSREYSTRIVVEGLAKGLGIESTRTTINGIAYTPSDIPGRPPVLCPGCPHRASFYLVKTSLGSKPVYCTDIGCYALGVQPPLAIGDVLICMGASVGLACGVSKAHDGPVLAVIGDSTFFHAAIPALIDAVNNDHRIIVTVLDNLTTAMTGFQPHPGSVDQNRRGSRVSVEEVAKGCGVKYVKVLDPYDVSEARRVLKEASNIPGPSVIVLRHLCCILETKKDGKKPVYRVDERCNGCRVCITIFGCPAMYLEGGAVKINSSLCNGCGFCVHVCPSKAIVRDRD